MIARLWAATLAWACAASISYAEVVTHTVLEFDDLDGWEFDTHARALEAFLETCPVHRVL